MTNMLQEVVRCSLKNLIQIYRTSKSIGHSGEKGAFREFFLTEVLRPLLPAQFALGSGIIVDSTGKQSMQTDLLIYSTYLAPVILKAEGHGIYPIDSVLAVLEVKSILKTTDYKQIVSAAELLHPEGKNALKIVSPGKLEKRNTTYPLFGVVAYTSNTKSSEVEHLNNCLNEKENLEKQRDSVRLICVLDKELWWWKDNDWIKANIEQMAEDEQTVEIGIRFLRTFLSRLYERAGSRGSFRLDEWL